MIKVAKVIYVSYMELYIGLSCYSTNSYCFILSYSQRLHAVHEYR